MAKGIEMNGMLRGKRGGNVYYRLDGEQISRVRNTTPNNPRTNKQLYQRAIMATIMKAYSAGKRIFDHSFEGKKVGTGCQRYFISKNAKLLRSALASDIENQPATSMKALVVGPGTNSPVPNAYLISEGSLQQTFFTITDPTAEVPIASLKTPAASSSQQTLIDYMAANGLVAGDIYTFVSIGLDQTDRREFEVDDANIYGNQWPGQFAFIRLIVKNVTDATIIAEDAKFSDVFEVDETGNLTSFSLLNEDLQSLVRDLEDPFNFDNQDCVSQVVGIIKSRDNEGLRSDAYMHWCSWDAIRGIGWEWALAAWKQGATSVGDSDLILEGADF